MLLIVPQNLISKSVLPSSWLNSEQHADDVCLPGKSFFQLLMSALANRTASSLWHCLRSVFTVMPMRVLYRPTTFHHRTVLFLHTAQHCLNTTQNNVGGWPPRYAPTPLLPLWAPKCLAPPSTPQCSSSFPRRIRSHAHRCSCLTH